MVTSGIHEHFGVAWVTKMVTVTWIRCHGNRFRLLMFGLLWLLIWLQLWWFGCHGYQEIQCDYTIVKATHMVTFKCVRLHILTCML